MLYRVSDWTDYLERPRHLKNDKNCLEDLVIEGKMILEWILGKLDGKVWTGCIWLRIGISGGLL
jgi:hypothetical protein